MKLLEVAMSLTPGKKYTAIFDNNGRKKRVSFGAAGMDDYTITRDREQRDRYRARHAKDLRTGDPTRAGFLSYYLLWGDSTSLPVNIANYKKKYNL